MTFVRYFVSYTYQGPRGPLFNYTELNLPMPVRSLADVNSIAEVIGHHRNIRHVTVLSFTPFDTQEGQR